jgi:hypothetical protein
MNSIWNGSREEKKTVVSAELLQFQGSGVRNSAKPLLMDGKYLMWKWNARTRV